MRAILCLVWLGSITAAVPLARAEPTPAPAGKSDDADKKSLAKEYVKAGIAAQKAGDFDTAITMYGKAYQLMPHPVLIFNSAQAHRLAGHKDRAVAMYKRYLEIAPDGDQAQTARDWIAELDPPPAPIPMAKPVAVAPATPMPSPPPPADLPAPAKPTTVAANDAVAPMPSDAAPSDAPADRPWKIALGATIGVAAIGAVYTTYEVIQLHRNVPQYIAQPGQAAEAPTSADCGRSADQILASKHAQITNYQQFKDLCSASSHVKIGYVITGVGLVGAAVSTFMIWRDRHSREVDAARRHHPRHDLAIAPVITRDSSGAMLSLTW
jgi:tetratricopeptide (TPR) repeat protein